MRQYLLPKYKSHTCVPFLSSETSGKPGKMSSVCESRETSIFQRADRPVWRKGNLRGSFRHPPNGDGLRHSPVTSIAEPCLTA